MGSWGGSEVTPQTPGTHRVPGKGAGGPRPAWDMQPGGAAAAAGAPGRGPSAQAPRGPAAAEPHGRAARPPDSPREPRGLALGAVWSPLAPESTGCWLKAQMLGPPGPEHSLWGRGPGGCIRSDVLIFAPTQG